MGRDVRGGTFLQRYQELSQRLARGPVRIIRGESGDLRGVQLSVGGGSGERVGHRLCPRPAAGSAKALLRWTLAGDKVDLALSHRHLYSESRGPRLPLPL